MGFINLGKTLLKFERSLEEGGSLPLHSTSVPLCTVFLCISVTRSTLWPLLGGCLLAWKIGFQSVGCHCRWCFTKSAVNQTSWHWQAGVQGDESTCPRPSLFVFFLWPTIPAQTDKKLLGKHARSDSYGWVSTPYCIMSLFQFHHYNSIHSAVGRRFPGVIWLTCICVTEEIRWHHIINNVPQF